jgi:pyruvate/2-oxoglutarate dehydrogenase complex dihydrolipoamide dehydrogenase (E3) component
VLDGNKRAVLIGAGYVGTEMADALTRRGLEVTVVEMAPAVLTTFDPDLGETWTLPAMSSWSPSVCDRRPIWPATRASE